MKTYYFYFVTNTQRTTLYAGMTNDLSKRTSEHLENQITEKGFSGKYKTSHLIYFEEYDSPTAAIEREKQVKKWSRVKKEALIATKNPKWEFLEFEI